MLVPRGMVRKDFTITSRLFEQLEGCPACRVYVPEEKPRMTFAQFYGIFVHRFLEYCLTKGHEAALAYIRTKKAKTAIRCCEGIDPSALFYGQSEIGYAHDPFTDTARVVSYSILETIDSKREQYGRADVVYDPPYTIPVIVDYKCGGFEGLPLDSTQLLGLGASYRASTNWDGDVELAFAGVMADGSIEWAFQTASKLDLDKYVVRARKVHQAVLETRERVDTGEPVKFVVGSYCSWCRLKDFCPMHKNLLARQN